MRAKHWHGSRERGTNTVMLPPDRPISIAHVLEATEGGTKQYLMDVCLGLPPERFRQTALVSWQRDPAFILDADRLAEGGVMVRFVPMRREISPLADLRAFRWLRAFFARHEFDIIHCHSSKAGFLGRWAAKKAGSSAALAYSPHAFAFQMAVGASRRCLYRRLERWAGRWTDLLIASCESERALAVDGSIIPPDRTVVVPTGIDVSRFASDAGQFREQLGVPPGHRLIGAVGAVVPQKGHTYLVDAARMVLAQMPDTTFVVAGEGPLRAELTARAQSAGLGRRMTFVGHREDIPGLLAALDLFVLPSLWEGLPYALLEAMAAGVPVVATEIPGVVDLVRAGETGWLAPPADAASLAEAILRALGEPEECAQMAARARELVATEHTREKMLAALAEVYERLATEARQ